MYLALSWVPANVNVALDIILLLSWHWARTLPLLLLLLLLLPLLPYMNSDFVVPRAHRSGGHVTRFPGYRGGQRDGGRIHQRRRRRPRRPARLEEQPHQAGAQKGDQEKLKHAWLSLILGAYGYCCILPGR